MSARKERVPYWKSDDGDRAEPLSRAIGPSLDKLVGRDLYPSVDFKTGISTTMLEDFSAMLGRFVEIDPR
eukprot:1153541-Pyramimonas_sp.AAC.1